MSWASHYGKQAKQCREAALQYARIGEDSRAQFFKDAAEAYERLREQAERSGV
jgi:hypothetical protein